MGRAILIIGGAALLVGVWIFSVLDAVQSDRSGVRALPKGAWLVIVFLFPVLGSALWFWLGRPRKSRYGSFGAPVEKPVKAPDDDPEYLRFLEAKARREKQDRQRRARKNPADSDQAGPQQSKDSDAKPDEGSPS